ncbi:branched-chain amino acid transport system II carrier protein [Geobacillus sp. BMUD]
MLFSLFFGAGNLIFPHTRFCLAAAERCCSG